MKLIIHTDTKDVRELREEVLLALEDNMVEDTLPLETMEIGIGALKIVLQGNTLDYMKKVMKKCNVKTVNDMEYVDNCYMWSLFYKKIELKFGEGGELEAKSLSYMGFKLTRKSNKSSCLINIVHFPVDGNIERILLKKMQSLSLFKLGDLDGNSKSLSSTPPLLDIFRLIKVDGSLEFDLDALELIKDAKWTITLRSMTDSAAATIMEEAFKAPYVDDNNCQRFLEFVAELEIKYQEDYCAFYTSIINASGVGKTRLMDQLSNGYANVMYCCLRPHNSTGTPPRSLFADSVLYADYPSAESYSCTIVENFCAYFVASFEVFTSYNQPNMEKQLTVDYQKDIVNSYDIHCSGIGDLFTGEFVKPVSLKVIGNSAEDQKSFEIWYNRLKKYMTKRLCYQSDKRCFFVFDEARGLIKNDTLRHTLFSYLRLAFTLLDISSNTRPFMSILLDTLSRVSDFQPAEFDPSLRTAERGRKILDPYYAIDNMDCHLFNTNISSLYSPNSAEMKDTSGYKDLNIKFLSSVSATVETQWMIDLGMMVFGRPLWFSHFLGALRCSDSGDLAIAARNSFEEVSFVAERKLDTRVGNTGPFSFENKIALISLVLGCRLTLNAESAEFLISDLMAFCFFIAPDRNTIMCGYASEPILAGGAASLLYFKGKSEDPNHRPGIRGFVFETIEKIARHGFVDKGEIGEYIARYLLINAMYNCLYFVGKSRRTMRPVLVTDFFKELCKIQNINDFAKVKQGTLLFNHFISLESVVTLDDMPYYYTRCAAIFCKTNNPGVDLILPVRLEGGAFSFILIQVRFYGGKTSLNVNDSLYRCNPFTCRLIGRSVAVSPPYISVVMALGGKKSRCETLEVQPNNSHAFSKPKKTGKMSGEAFLACTVEWARIEGNIKTNLKANQTSLVIHGLGSYLPRNPLDLKEISEIQKLNRNKLADVHSQKDMCYRYLNDLVDPISKVFGQRIGLKRPLEDADESE